MGNMQHGVTTETRNHGKEGFREEQQGTCNMMWKIPGYLTREEARGEYSRRRQDKGLINPQGICFIFADSSSQNQACFQNCYLFYLCLVQYPEWIPSSSCVDSEPPHETLSASQCAL